MKLVGCSGLETWGSICAKVSAGCMAPRPRRNPAPGKLGNPNNITRASFQNNFVMKVFLNSVCKYRGWLCSQRQGLLALRASLPLEPSATDPISEIPPTYGVIIKRSDRVCGVV